MTANETEGSDACNASDSTDDGQTRRQFLRSVGVTGAGLAIADNVKAEPPTEGHEWDTDYYKFDSPLSAWPSTGLETRNILFDLGEYDVEEPFDLETRGWGADNRVLVHAKGSFADGTASPGFLLTPENAEALAFRLLETAKWVREHPGYPDGPFGGSDD